MTITLHAMSGSPFSWKVALALEHKQLPFTLRYLSVDAGDLRSPDFARMNPRRRAPVMTDGEICLYESEAILRYLEDAYPKPTLYPGELPARALAYRLCAEVTSYLAVAMEELVLEVLFKPDPATRDPAKIERARQVVGQELEHFEQQLGDGYLAGQLSAADFTLYPCLMLCLRIEKRLPALAFAGQLGPRLSAWKARIEALPYYERTYPPHWKPSS
ncbi:MAG TPA: glutathione S-transferase family protein [Polyangiaceae bacterium]|nr:glutathione S-transferase family protein [Polyangiaceae bacterium]